MKKERKQSDSDESKRERGKLDIESDLDKNKAKQKIVDKFKACDTRAKVSHVGRRDEEIALRLIKEVDLDDVLFMRYWCDATWDHDSEDNGDFFDMVFAKDGVLVQISGNIRRENKKISRDFWDKVDAAMINVKPEKSWVCVYFNKAVAKDMEWDPENYVLKYNWHKFKFYEPEYSA